MNKDIVKSEIRDSALIVALDVQRAEARPWRPDPQDSNNEARTVRVAGRVSEVYKADAGAPRGVQEFEVNQLRPISGRIAQDYGPWSKVEIAPGKTLLVFCPPPGSPPEEAFSQATLVLDAAAPRFPHATEDLDLARQLMSAMPAVLQQPATLQMLLGQRAKIGPLLGRFLVRGVADLNPPTSDLLLQLLEAPGTATSFRHVVLGAIVDDFTLGEAPKRDDRIRAARIMAAMLSEPRQSALSLHESISQGWLYNAVFDEHKQALFASQDAFPTSAGRANLQTAVSRFAMDSARRDRLIQWLN